MDPVGPILACLMEAALYGAYVALFCWSLWISSGNSTVPRFLRITSFAAVALATTHVVINFLCLWPFMDYLEQYGDVAASYLNLTTVDQPESFSWLTAALPPAHKESVYIILGDVIFISTVVLHDFVLIWRLHVAWNRTYLICIPSVILLLASGALSYAAVRSPQSPVPMMSVQARLRNWHCIAIYTGAFNNILTPSLTVHKLLQLKSEIASTSTSSSDATRDTTSVIPTGTDLQMQEARRETEKDLNGAILIVISYSALFVIILSLGSFFIIVMPEKAIWYMSLLAQLTGVLPVLLMINSCYKKKRTQGSA